MQPDLIPAEIQGWFRETIQIWSQSTTAILNSDV